MVIGGLACPREHKRAIVHEIHKLKGRHHAQGEFGWKRLSPNKKAFYFELVELFASDQDLSFRCLVVDRNILDHDLYNQGDPELGFYKLYYQMLVHWLHPGCVYHIYLDWQQNREQHRFSELKHVLETKLSGKAKIDCLEPVTSRNLPLIELTDLLIGAVGYTWNSRQGSETRREFCDALSKAVSLRTLKTATVLSESKFNIFHFTGR